MPVINKKTILTFIAALSCQSCQAEPEWSGPVSAKHHTHSEKITASDSPVGYWVLDLSYPVFSGKGHKRTLAKNLNNKIENLVDRFQCTNGGDESFRAEIHTLEEGLLSLRYVAMWNCSAMPSPDSTEGAISLVLPSVEEVALEKQFITQEHFKRFSKKVKSLYDLDIKDNDKTTKCPYSKWDYFTVEPTTLSLYFDASSHYPSHCETKLTFSREELAHHLITGSPIAPKN